MSKRDLCVEKLKRKLNGWNAELDRLDAKADTIDASSRESYQAAIQGVKDELQQLEMKLMVLKNTTTDAWQDLRTAFERAWNEFEDDANTTLLRLTGEYH
jgi:hypothetical protein